MKTKFFYISGLVVLLSLLGLKEYFVFQQISQTKTHLQSLITQQFEAAQNAEKVREIAISSVAFETFLEPVIILSNKLLFPPFRNSIVSDWAKEVHLQLSQGSKKRLETLSGKMDVNFKTIRDAVAPGVDRLVSLLKEAQSVDANSNCIDTVQNEMKAIKEFASEKDQQVLADLKEEGLQRIQDLRRILKKASVQKMGELLSSGRFIQEIEQPAIALILKIKQEDLRQAAWKEFSTKLNEVFTKKKMLLAQEKKTKRQQEIEKLFNDQAMHAFVEDHRDPEFRDKRQLAPAPSSASEDSLYENDRSEGVTDFSNPAESR
ncbi:MAG: hypothetical protein J0L93_09575 [Deltaproteobacteria bacterium]|nr:hypothetical protein [Deltaproteobacteria bacterium]